MEIIHSLFLCFITLSLLTCPIQSRSSGFTINLVHRDSPLSPYHNSSVSYNEIICNSIRRSMTRSSHIFTPKLASSPPTIQSPLTAVTGEYLMKISVGTPPQEFLAVADTGSHLTWIQCKPCIECYNQDSPLFDPEKSSTYKIQLCHSKACQSLQPPSCDDENFCKYKVNYADGSLSKGDLSLDSFTFESTSGNPFVFPNVSFGCGHRNHGNFDESSDGIVGLGNSDLSIVNQLSETINGKFSYCMVPLSSNVSSKLSFGSDAFVSGSGVQRTPIFTKDPAIYYHLNLESVSIGDTNLEFESTKNTNKANDENGNIIIDSGSTITLFPIEFYKKVEDEFKSKIPRKPIMGESGLRLCYKNEDEFVKKVPNVTFHFTGADWDLGVLNTMLDMGDGVLCLSMAPATGAVFGNVQQLNYLVGYDLDAKTLSFKKTDCRLQS
ncbi:Aspartic proteinase nepenthesin-1 [Heracleum sosnowskyi]|uniref:Aspartic proteinase nepenthesin-1 n=1 Tax=Heracleum sosnowskyi TaxID=360622 RepID=A0AAD8HVF9_9APIA|nr:Aspartic proteinase nepenthesin-1 [Heracleum sosnowskyi]